MRQYLILLFLPISIFAQEYSVSGKITDEYGSPVPYVNIVLSLKTKYAISDVDGFYRISNIPQGTYTLTVSSLGFEKTSQQITVNKNLILNVTLNESSEKLGDIVITTKKSSEKQEERPISIRSLDIAEVATQTNIISDVVDKISGVRIRRSGSVGDQSDVSINGLNGTAVRTFIDGIPLEFLYPRADLATLPLSGIKRIDVYKGVLPVNLGADALGGGINIVTEDNLVNRIRGSYSVGSFNTHIADFNVNVVNDKQTFFKVTAGLQYSDNDYTFKAPIRVVQNPGETGTPQFLDIGDFNVRRFHDRYRIQYSSVSAGTRNKKWTDFAQIQANYFKADRQLQNGLAIDRVAFGEATDESETVSVIGRYRKKLINEKLKLNLIANYSQEVVDFTDTTANVYNWLGNVIDVNENSRGEFGEATLTETTTDNYSNRLSLDYEIAENHSISFSNFLAYQDRETLAFDIDNPTEFDVLPAQSTLKNISGIQYSATLFNEKVEAIAAAKNYLYDLRGFTLTQNLSVIDIRQEDNFLGWNAALKVVLSENIFIRGSYERGFLIPTIDQFAGNGSNIEANPRLIPEESDNYNFGITFSKAFNDDYSLFIAANGFIREQRNIIAIIPESVPQQFANLDDADSQGVEGELKVKFLGDFNYVANVSFVDKVFARATTQGGVGSDLVGTLFPNTPRFFYNTELSWNKRNVFNTGIDARLYTGFTHVDTFNIRPVGQQDNENAFVPEQNRLDAGFSLTFYDGKLTTAFNAINITDEDLFDNFSIPRPGRNFNFKVIYELSNF
ncbi:MAG: TonB-dependent receptor [Bacteroidota bacterium]